MTENTVLEKQGNEEEVLTAETLAEGSKEAKLERLTLKYITNREVARERTLENESLIDEIRDLYEQLGFDQDDDDYVIELPSGDYARVSKKPRIREVLNKDELAEELQLSKEDIKTPFDISKLTSDGKLTPKMISMHTETVIKNNVSVKRLKNKPKKKK